MVRISSHPMQWNGEGDGYGTSLIIWDEDNKGVENENTIL